KPVDAFTVTEGRAESFPQMPQWFNNRSTDGTNGHLEVFLNKGRVAPAIMVQSKDYLPQSSGPITTLETNISFELKHGTGPRGIVLKPDGTPVADATVYLVDLQNGVYVQDKDMSVDQRMFRGTRTTSTAADGTFSFSPTIDDYAILILEEDGFAQATVDALKRNDRVHLQPWAKVEGKLMIGSRPGTNEEVHLWPAHVPYQYYPRNFPPLNMYLKTETDNEGRFSFNRVPPIDVEVYHQPKVKDEKMGMNPMSQTFSFSLKPGEVRTVTVGGQGRPVIGRVVVNGYEGTIKWRSDVFSIEKILPPNDGLPDPAVSARELSAKIQMASSDDEKKRLLEQMRKGQDEIAIKTRAFYATDKGRDYYFQNRRYCLNFTPDGAFRIEDVPGGKYRLRIDLREGGGGPMGFASPAIGSINKEFEVPESPGGRTDEAFDLGTIEMQARKALSAGKLAPDFAVRTVDDKPLKLSDFSGKYILLDFWAVWCGPCVAETPHLKDTYAAFKDDKRFQMIGLSLDPLSKTPQEYARKNDLAWIMGFLGDWSKTDLPSAYGVEGIPAIFLIGPDRKIIARDLRGDAIKLAVERALREPQK
ncbi:MAG TPA: redoxin domain-containing protein, partial [Patescibacteria group bacterium]|nr:redoxin domain-containing protein [Patescibacteria group bacterium]